MRPLLALLLLCGSLTLSAQPLLAVAPNVERAQQAKYEAGYRALHQAISRAAGWDSRLQFMPVADVRARLARREAQMQMGGICGVKRHVPVVYSRPFARVVRHLVSADSSPQLSELKDIRLLRLGLIKGYFYQLPDGRSLQGLGFEVLYSKDLSTSIQLLLAGRVDAILANGRVASSVADHMGQPQRLHYNSDKAFSEHNLCYVFPATAQSAVLLEQINAAIVSLYQSGELRRALPAPYLLPRDQDLR